MNALPVGIAVPKTSLSWQGSEIPSLYGIRGVSAMIVVLSHVGAIQTSHAIYAVITFFVLSGFLITHLLLREHDKTGRVSLRQFYIRRSLRIFPAFYGYAACYILGRILLTMPIDWPNVIACLTYTGNYYSAFSGKEPATMVHTWSLAIEEQFYLLWPFIFWRWAANRRGLLKTLAGVIIFVWVYRWLAVLLAFPGTYIFSSFETRSDALAIGCLLAVANHEGCIPRWLIGWKWLVPVSLSLVWVSSVTNINGPKYSWTFAALTAALGLIHAIAHSQTVWYGWLNSRPLRALGVISYSLYLYNPFASQLPAAIRSVPVAVLFSVAMACASFFLIERPFLTLKDRMTAVQQASKPN